MNVRPWSVVPWILVVLSVGAGFATRAAGQASAPSPVGVARAVYPIDVKAGQYDLIVQVGDFPPGSGVPLHVHPGPVVAAVITGEMTFSAHGKERVVKTGQGWVEIPDDPNAVFNRSTGYARVVAAYLVPRGATQTKFVK